MPSSNCPRCGAPLSGATGGVCVLCAGRLALDSAGSPDQEDAPKQGARLGDYELLDELGRGAMGVVYRARQLSLKRVVALKVVQSGQFASEGERKRFLAEAELAATLDHPNIVPVHEVGTAEGRPFCAMKFVEGRSLAAMLGEGFCARRQCEAHRPPPRLLPGARGCCVTAAALIAKVARAVHHAHQRSVIHRDLKPANILVDAAGEPHVTDFGLARRLGTHSSLTLTGSPLGTPAYMSPEQARGEKTVTTASDIWSLGVMLYELLAGHPPFEAENVPALLRKIAEEEPEQFANYDLRFTRETGSGASSGKPVVNRKSEIVNQIDPDLATIALKCLEKEPARRYASAAELADDLGRWQRNEPILARRTTGWERALKWTARHPRQAAMVLALHLVLLVGAVGVLWQAERANRHARTAEWRAEESRDRLLRLHVLNAQERLDNGDPLAALPWLAAALAEEPADSARRPVYRAALANILRRSPGLDHVWWSRGAEPVFTLSADGGRMLIANGQANEYVLHDTTNGVGRSVPGQKCSAAAFSPDGSRFGVGNWNVARLFASATLQPIGPPLTQMGWVAQVGFSPDGRCLATLSRQTGVRLWNVDTGEPLAPELPHPQVMSCAFSSDSRLIATSGQDEFVRLWEVPSGRLLATNHLGSPSRCAFSPDGQWLAVARRSGRDALLLRVSTLERAAVLRGHTDYVEFVAFAADSQTLATGSLDSTARLWSLPDGKPRTPPIELGSECAALAFAPEGDALATGGRDGRVRVWDARTGAARSPWLPHAGAVRDLQFTPDGTRLAVGSSDGSVRLWRLVEPAVAPLVLRQSGDMWNAHFFDHSERVVVRGSRSARIFDTRTGEPLTPSLEHEAGVHWADVSPDGRLLLTEGRDQRVRAWRLPEGELLETWHLSADIVDARWLTGSGRFAAMNEHGVIVIGTALSNAPLRRLTDDQQAGRELAVSPDRRMIGASFAGRKFGLWEGEGGRRIVWADMPGEVRKIRFSPDSTLVATGDVDGGISFRRCADGQALGSVVRHAERILDLAFCPDGQCLASVSADGLVRISRVPDGEAVTAAIRPAPGAMQLAWSPDGRWLLVGGQDGGQIWDARTSAPVTPLVRYARPVAGAAFTPDSRALLVLTEDGRLRRERLDVPDWPDDDWRFVARAISSREVEAGGSAMPWLALSATNAAAADAAALNIRWQQLRPRLQELLAPIR